MYSITHKKKNSSDSGKEILMFIMPVAVEAVVLTAVSILSLIFYVSTDYYYILMLISLAAGGFASGFIYCRKKRQKGLVNGLIVSLAADLLLLILSLILNGFSFDYHIILSAVCHILMSGAGGIVSVNIRKKSKVKR